MARALTPRIRQWSTKKYDELPADIRQLIDRYLAAASPFFTHWDSMTPELRIAIAENYDANHPNTNEGENEAERMFRRGFSELSIRRRNACNAKNRRQSRQKISDTEILRLMREVNSLPPHKQCSDAHRRAIAAGNSISIQKFRKRWNALKKEP
jgi:hypothetical protein